MTWALSTDEVREAYILAADTTNADRDNGEDFDAWLAAALREARAETWDEAVAAVFAWWNTPDGQRPALIVNPYGAGMKQEGTDDADR